MMNRQMQLSKCSEQLTLLHLHLHQDRLRRATLAIESAASQHIGVVRLIAAWAQSHGRYKQLKNA